jgi:hypothetical protein
VKSHYTEGETSSSNLPLSSCEASSNTLRFASAHRFTRSRHDRPIDKHEFAWGGTFKTCSGALRFASAHPQHAHNTGQPWGSVCAMHAWAAHCNPKYRLWQDSHRKNITIGKPSPLESRNTHWLQQAGNNHLWYNQVNCA